jgi:hypothetical protein
MTNSSHLISHFILFYFVLFYFFYFYFILFFTEFLSGVVSLLQYSTHLLSYCLTDTACESWNFSLASSLLSWLLPLDTKYFQKDIRLARAGAFFE